MSKAHRFSITHKDPEIRKILQEIEDNYIAKDKNGNVDLGDGDIKAKDAWLSGDSLYLDKVRIKAPKASDNAYYMKVNYTSTKKQVDFVDTDAIDHGSLSGLTDDDHTQYILHSLADAANDFLIASGANTFVKKTLAETGAILEGDINHDNLVGFVADEHIDWTGDAGADNIHDNNIVSSSITQHEGDIDHDALTNTHNLTTDIDHSTITNNNLITNHEQLKRYAFMGV